MKRLILTIVGVLPTACLSLASNVVAEEVSGRVVDGLGRPVAGVVIKLLHHSYPPLKTEVFYDGITAQDGSYHGTVMIPQSVKDIGFQVSKAGYADMSGPLKNFQNEEIVMWAKIPRSEIPRLLTLQGDQLQRRVHEILASFELVHGGHDGDLFAIQHHILSAVRSALNDAHILNSAIRLLCKFGTEDDLKTIRTKFSGYPEKLMCYVGTLTSPNSDDEWNLLKTSLIDKDLWMLGADARLALLANGTDKALAILKAAQVAHPESHLERTIRWVVLHPKGFTAYPDLDNSIRSASGIITMDGLESLEEQPQEFKVTHKFLDEHGEKALIYCYYGPAGYEMVFHKINGLWVLKRVWFTVIA